MDPEMLVKVGGKRWQQGNYDRVYFNDLPRWYGIEYTTYKTGNISGASLNGSRISNSLAYGLVNDLDHSKLWYDVGEDTFQGKGPNINDYLPDLVRAIRAAVMAQQSCSPSEDVTQETE